jgi:hypothetical protein
MRTRLGRARLGGKIEIRSLAALVPLSEEQLRCLLGDYTGSSLAWQDMCDKVDPVRLREFGEALRSARLQTLGSRFWVSGYSELIRQWHPTKNGDAFPSISLRFHPELWWRCAAGPDHEWQARSLLLYRTSELRRNRALRCSRTLRSRFTAAATIWPHGGLKRQMLPARGRSTGYAEAPWSLSRLCVAQISAHSPRAFESPRSRSCRRPRACLI